MNGVGLVAVMAAEHATAAAPALRAIAPQIARVVGGTLVAFALPPDRGRPGRQARMKAFLLHRRLLESARLAGPVLPGAFGVAGLPGEAIQRGLDLHAERLVEALAAVADKAEYQVEIAVPPRNLVAHLGGAAEFAELRAELRTLGPTRAGPRIAQAAEDLRSVVRQRALDRLAGAAVGVVERAPGSADGVASAALLVDASGTASLDGALEEIDASPPGGWTIRCIGPLPPVSFHAVAFSTGARHEAEALRAEFGLGPAADAGAARRAWRAAARTGLGGAVAAAAIAGRGRRLETLLSSSDTRGSDAILLEIGDEITLAARGAGAFGGSRAA